MLSIDNKLDSTTSTIKQEDLQNALADSVEDYIEFCKETNKIPEKSCSSILS